MLIVQTSQANMILNREFDTIYHEHVSFFNARSMNVLAQRCGLRLDFVDTVPVHGESYVFVLSRPSESCSVAPSNLPTNPNATLNIFKTPAVDRLAHEEKQGLYDRKTYQTFATDCLRTIRILKGQVEHHRQRKYLTVGFGAPAKGNTVLNFAQLKLDVLLDENKLKQGKLSPGMNIPVKPLSYLYMDEPYVSKQVDSLRSIRENPNFPSSYVDEVQKKYADEYDGHAIEHKDHNTQDNLFVVLLAWNFAKESEEKLIDTVFGKHQKRNLVIYKHLPCIEQHTYLGEYFFDMFTDKAIGTKTFHFVLSIKNRFSDLSLLLKNFNELAGHVKHENDKLSRNQERKHNDFYHRFMVHVTDFNSSDANIIQEMDTLVVPHFYYQAPHHKKRFDLGFGLYFLHDYQISICTHTHTHMSIFFVICRLEQLHI